MANNSRGVVAFRQQLKLLLLLMIQGYYNDSYIECVYSTPSDQTYTLTLHAAGNEIYTVYCKIIHSTYTSYQRMILAKYH